MPVVVYSVKVVLLRKDASLLKLTKGQPTIGNDAADPNQAIVFNSLRRGSRQYR